MAIKLLALILHRPLLFALGCLAILVTSSLADEPAVSEDELKAAYLYNFTRFIEWPKDSFKSENDRIEVAIYENESFARVLSTLLKDKKAHGRSFKVKNISSVSEAKTAHVLFIPKEKSRQAAELLEALQATPVLTVGESPQFLQQGGVINLRFQDNQLRFEINAGAAEKAKLQVSSQLMRLGTNVKKAGDK